MKHKTKKINHVQQLKEAQAHIEAMRGALALAAERQSAAERRSEDALRRERETKSQLETAQYDLNNERAASAEYKNKLMLYFMARSSGSVDGLRLHQLECAINGGIAPISVGGKF